MEQILIDESFVDADLINHRGQKYPRILIQNDEIVKPAIAPEHLCQDIFVEPKNQIFFIRLIRQYRMKGFIQMLNFIKNSYNESINNNNDNNKSSNNNNNHYGIFILFIIATILLKIHALYIMIYLHYYPFDKYSDDELMNKFIDNPEWKSGIIRTFVWHPNSLQCAIALINDLIYIYSADNKRQITHVKCLKNFQQKQISSICWHPKLSNILAVACKNKILIWNVDQLLSANIIGTELINPQQSTLKIIETHLKSPIVNMTFNPMGNMLVCCSPRNASISLCCFDEQCKLIKIETIQMKQFSSIIHLPQFTALQWSYDGQRLLALTTLNTKPICVFESFQWSYKFWTFPHEYCEQLCQTATWSRTNGMILLFTPTQSSKIYALTFYDRAEAGDVGGGNSKDGCILVYNTKQLLLENSTIIHRICWDIKSTKLAVLYQQPSDTIIIFNTTLNPGLNISPFRIIKPSFNLNNDNIRCLMINFHDNYIDPGCLLTICWSNGFVIHLTFEQNNDYLKIINNNNNNDHQLSSLSLNESIRSLTSLCTSFDETSFYNQKNFNKRNEHHNQSFNNKNKNNNNGFNNNSNNNVKRINKNNNDKINYNQQQSPLSTSTVNRNVLYSTRLHYD